MTRGSFFTFAGNRIVRTSAIVVALAAAVPAVLFFWPSPLHGEFQVVAAESLDNSIQRIQANLRFFEAEATKARTPEKKHYWMSERDKAKEKLEGLWKRKFGK